MDGKHTAELMINSSLRSALFKHARRYTKCIETQEEYVQDAWIRIAECPDDMTDEWYEEQGRKAIKACYDRRWYASNVRNKSGANPNGISRRTVKKVPRNAIALDYRRYLKIESETIDSWYYVGEWEEYGLSKSDLSNFQFYEIVVTDT